VPAPTKGTRTRDLIVASAAPLFNQKGFHGAAMSDIMAATGLEKGGLYRHFDSKDALALAAFDHALALVSERLTTALATRAGALQRLDAFAHAFLANFEQPPLPGGCPMLNTAVDSDDAHPALRTRARQALDYLQRRLAQVVREGVWTRELRAGTDPEAVATFFLASLEGGTMLAGLYADPAYLRRTVDQLTAWLRTLASASAPLR
jgi:AcrR family transcriptional regulator